MQSLDDVIELVSVTYTENDMGDNVQVQTKRQVFAKRKSVRQSEFYQSQSTGLRPEVQFDIWSLDYQDETQLSYNSKTYTIIRTFDKGNEFTELIASGTVSMGDPNVKK